MDGKQSYIPPVIGLPTLIELNLIKRIDSIKQSKNHIEDLLQEYKDVFESKGHIQGFEYDIKLTDNYVPRVHPCSKVPVALMKPLKQKFDDMLQNGIIEKVDQPTEWVHPLVLAKK